MGFFITGKDSKLRAVALGGIIRKMPIFEIEKDDLLGLDDGQLEELIARLCEAELASKRQSISRVRWGGNITAADGGVDVRVTVEDPAFVGDFIRRGDTVYQAKVPSMAKVAIEKEISGKGTSKDLFQALAASHGAYCLTSALMGPNSVI